MRKHRQWLTPEEIEANRKLKQKVLYVSIPVGAVIIGAATSLLINAL